MKNLHLLTFTLGVAACSTVSQMKYREIKGFFPGNDMVKENTAVQLFFIDSASMATAFHPAATMGTKLKSPDFSKEFAVGIALPAGTEERQIVIDAVEYENKTAKVFYKIQSTGKT